MEDDKTDKECSRRSLFGYSASCQSPEEGRVDVHRECVWPVHGYEYTTCHTGCNDGPCSHKVPDHAECPSIYQNRHSPELLDRSSRRSMAFMPNVVRDSVYASGFRCLIKRRCGDCLKFKGMNMASVLFFFVSFPTRRRPGAARKPKNSKS